MKTKKAKTRLLVTIELTPELASKVEAAQKAITKAGSWGGRVSTSAVIRAAIREGLKTLPTKEG